MFATGLEMHQIVEAIIQIWSAFILMRSKHCDYSVVTMSIIIGKAVSFSVLLQTFCNLQYTLIFLATELAAC